MTVDEQIEHNAQNRENMVFLHHYNSGVQSSFLVEQLLNGGSISRSLITAATDLE